MDSRLLAHRTMSMAVKQEFTYRKPICPFISSTFQDFQVERDYLVKKVFPTIDSLCRQRGTYFAPVDLRWGINDAQTKSGLVIQLCLEYVAHCSPFFICLLGERYGSQRFDEDPQLPDSYDQLPVDASWLDKNFMVAAAAGYDWILQKNYQNCSVTELEILQAAMQGDGEFCYFYFRQPDHLDNLFKDLPDAERREKFEIYLAESETSELKVKDLKARIVNRGLPIRYFQTPEELGRLVLQDWTAVVNKLYPSMTDAVLEACAATEMFGEWMAHETFAETRRRIFVRTPDVEATFALMSAFARSAADEPIVAHAESTPVFQSHSFSSILRQRKRQPLAEYKSILLLVGDRGSGKTSILANWVKEFKEECGGGVKVFSHYVGSSAESADVTMLLRRCTLKMRDDMPDFTSGDSDLAGGAGSNEDLSEFHHACEEFLAAVSLQPCVLVIDGVDELAQTRGQTTQQVKEFTWLPYPLPPQCKVIITSARSDSSFKVLSTRADTTITKVPTISETSARKDIIREHLAVHCKCLSEEQLDKIVSCKLSDRPLFLTVLANELRVFGVRSHLDYHLESYLEATSCRDLWSRIIVRWIKDYSWRSPSVAIDAANPTINNNDLSGWVADALRLIAVSRNGLSQSEILDLLKQLGYSGKREVSGCDWALFRSAALDALFERPQGLLNFFHQHFKEAVEYSLLGTVMPDSAGQKVKVKAQDHLTHLASPNVNRLMFHRYLSDYFCHKDLLHSRVISELPWQLERSGQMERLRQFLMKPKVFLVMCGDKLVSSKRLELIGYWRSLSQANYSPTVTYWQMLKLAGGEDEEEEEDDVNYNLPPIVKVLPLTSVPQICAISASSQSIKFHGDLDELHEPISERLSLSIRSNHPTELLGEWDEETEEDEEAVSGRGSSVPGKTDSLRGEELARLAMSAGQLLSVLGHFVDAEQMLISAHSTLKQLTPLTELQQLLVASVQESLGSLYLFQLKRDQAADWYNQALNNVTELMELSLDAEQVKTLVETRGRLMDHLGHMMTYCGRFKQAEHLLLRAKGCYESAGCWVGRAIVQYHIGVLRLHQEDFEKAESHINWAISSLERWYGKSHPRVADALNDLASLLSNKKNTKSFNMQQGESLYRRALTIREKTFGLDHLLVATTLFHLGKLLKDVKSIPAETEAVGLLKRSLDIRTAKLGTDHIQTASVRRLLRYLEVQLQRGHKEGDGRTMRGTERPFSSLSWHDKDLVAFNAKTKADEGREKTGGSSHFKEVVDLPVPDIVEVRDKVFKCNNHTHEGIQEPAADGEGEEGNGTKDHKEYVHKLETLAARRKTMSRQHSIDKSHDDSETEYIDSFANLDDLAVEASSNDRVQHHAKALVKDGSKGKSKGSVFIRSQSAPFTLRTSPRSCTIPRDTIREPSLLSKRMRSAPPGGRQHYRPSSSMAIHKKTCYTPGPHSVDVENAYSAVIGFNSSLDSLLGPKPCPRNISTGIHHKAAWYHVPGRYSTIAQIHAPKRLQKRVRLRSNTISAENQMFSHTAVTKVPCQ